jgi:hypothetical protein
MIADRVSTAPAPFLQRWHTQSFRTESRGME